MIALNTVKNLYNLRIFGVKMVYFPVFIMIFICDYSLFLQIRNAASNLCVDTRFRNQNDRFGLEKCIKDGAHGGEQVI